MKNTNVSPSLTFRILVVDDNRHGLSARTTVLHDLGHDVTAASTPEEALEHFTETSFDLVVTDYRMPRMNGVELIAHLRQTRPNMPIILISGMVDTLGLNERNTGADVVIAKSNTEVQHLTRAVNRLLKRKAPKKPVRPEAAMQLVRTKTV